LKIITAKSALFSITISDLADEVGDITDDFSQIEHI